MAGFKASCSTLEILGGEVPPPPDQIPLPQVPATLSSGKCSEQQCKMVVGKGRSQQWLGASVWCSTAWGNHAMALNPASRFLNFFQSCNWWDLCIGSQVLNCTRGLSSSFPHNQKS